MGLDHGLIVLMARSVAKDDDDEVESALDVEVLMSRDEVRAVQRRSMVC